MSKLKSDMDFKALKDDIKRRHMRESAKRKNLALVDVVPIRSGNARDKFTVLRSEWTRMSYKLMPKLKISIDQQGYFYRCAGCGQISDTMNDFITHHCKNGHKISVAYYPIQCFTLTP